MNNYNNFKRSLLFKGLLFACLLCSITKPGVSAHTLSREPQDELADHKDLRSSLDDDIDDGDGRSGMTKEDEEPFGSRSAGELSENEDGSSRNSPISPESEQPPPAAPRSTENPPDDSMPRSELPEAVEPAGHMRSEMPPNRERASDDGRSTLHGEPVNPINQDPSMRGERSDLNTESPEIEPSMTTTSPNIMHESLPESRSDLSAAESLDDDGFSKSEPLDSDESSRSSELPSTNTEHHKSIETIEKKEGASESEDVGGSRSGLDLDMTDDDVNSRGSSGADEAAADSGGDWEIDDDDSNSRSGVSEDIGSRAGVPSPNDAAKEGSATKRHHPRPIPRPYWNVTTDAPTITKSLPSTTAKPPIKSPKTKPATSPGTTAAPALMTPATTKPSTAAAVIPTMPAPTKPMKAASAKSTKSAAAKLTKVDPTKSTTMASTVQPAKPSSALKETKPALMSGCPAKPAHECQCDYKGLKDSDKLLAVVVTKRGGFRGRRINSKAFTVLISGNHDGVPGIGNGTAPIDDNFVFPAGHYYFPRPLRFAHMRT